MDGSHFEDGCHLRPSPPNRLNLAGAVFIDFIDARLPEAGPNCDAISIE
jgi:hypothetical protein